MKKKSPRGSAQTELVIGRAANKLKVSIDSFKTAVAEINTLAEKADELQSLVAKREEQIAELDTIYAEKKRAAEIKFELDIKAAKVAVLETFMENEGLIAVPKRELSEKSKRLAQLESDFVKEVNAKVAEQKSIIVSQKESEKQLLEAAHATAEATTRAELNQKNNQIDFLTAQVTMWKDALDAERNAGIERAKASSVGSINISGQK